MDIPIVENNWSTYQIYCAGDKNRWGEMCDKECKISDQDWSMSPKIDYNYS